MHTEDFSSGEFFGKQPETRTGLWMHLLIHITGIGITILELCGEAETFVKPDVGFFRFVNADGDAAESAALQMGENRLHQPTAESLPAIFRIYPEGA